ncbi:MAG: efflux RND transporter periplasmic adaptor subunit [Bacteroidota bacterium]
MNSFVGCMLGCALLFFLGACSEQQRAENNAAEAPIQRIPGTLTLTRQQTQSADIGMDTAMTSPVSAPLTLSGRVALNERLSAHITARVRGRVEQVHSVAGDHVKKGEPVVELYSQEFLTMQAEFIQAEERLKRVTPGHSDYSTAQAIYHSARKKLQIVGVTDAEIDALAEGHRTLTLLPVRAPFDGALLTGEAHLGAFVDLGTEFFTIANLQTPWVIADVVEHDLPLVSEGLWGDVIAGPYPQERFKGRLTSIIDLVDEKSRTVKVRFEVQNRNEKLKPGMFATVVLRIRFGGNNIKIPSSAVMENKETRYVFVALNDTAFEQRPIRIGTETKAFTEVVSGLIRGERVVSRGTFFLKSELGRSAFAEEE